MGKVIWTNKANDHLKAIHDFIAGDSPLYATNFVKELVKATRKLEVFPLIGGSVPEFKDLNMGLREVIYQGYRIIYQVNKDQHIEIYSCGKW
jgi:toxin ParE1/3/4